MTQTNKILSLLLLDDDQNVLKALKRALSGAEYEIHSFTNPAEALEFLKQNPVGVIVSDQHMPTMSGAAFLREASIRQPKSIRIALTGHNEQETIARAANEGSPWRIITKPWDSEELRAILGKAFRIYNQGQDS